MSIKIHGARRILREVEPYSVLWQIKRRARHEFCKRISALVDGILDGRAEREFERRDRSAALFSEWAKRTGVAVDSHNVVAVLDEWNRLHRPPQLREPIWSFALCSEAILEIAGGNRPTFREVSDWIFDMYNAQQTSRHRNEWNLDASVGVHVHDGHFYLIPFIDPINIVGDFIEPCLVDLPLEDFSYYDNVDRPDNATAARWAERRAVWHEILADPTQVLSLDIVSMRDHIDLMVRLDRFRRDLEAMKG